MSTSLNERMRWAVFCPTERLWMGLIQRITTIVSSFKWFTSQISSLCLWFSISMAIATLWAMRLYTRDLKIISGPITLQKATRFSSTFIQLAGLLSSVLKSTPLCFCGRADHMPLPLAPSLSRILLNSTLSCGALICSSPLSMSCLARIPSLAASFGFACGGGLTSTFAYVCGPLRG